MKRILHATLVFLLGGCNTNHPTGSPAGAIVGGAVGAGAIAALGGSKPLMVLAGLGGGALGYYVTTLRYDSGGVIQGGGEVYVVGQLVGINIPTDNLFESNSDEFLPQAGPILDSAATVLQRYPNNNILISGNTSGFGQARWELDLSLKRAEKVSAYLWNAGINNFKGETNDTRKLNYVGYGDFFPISSDLTNKGIRENSHVQITSYPSKCDLQLNKSDQLVHNIGGLEDNMVQHKKCYKDGGMNGDGSAIVNYRTTSITVFKQAWWNGGVASRCHR